MWLIQIEKRPESQVHGTIIKFIKSQRDSATDISLENVRDIEGQWLQKQPPAGLQDNCPRGKLPPTLILTLTLTQTLILTVGQFPSGVVVGTPSAGILQDRSSDKFRKICGKTSLLQSLFFSFSLFFLIRDSSRGFFL